MSDAFSKITAILLCIWMMFIIPVFYMREESDKLKQTYILEEITMYVDGVRNTGILSIKDYNRFAEELSRLGSGYRIELVHSRHVYDEMGVAVDYFADTYYSAQILQHFSMGNDYLLKKNDYLRVVIYDYEDNVVAWYGGSVRYEAY